MKLIGNLSCSIRRRRIFQSVILCCISLVLAAIIFNYFQRNRKPFYAAQKTDQRSFSKSFQTIKGFDYKKSENGKPVFSIIADRFKIEKAKVGLFRFGLMKQVVFDNAKIKLIVANTKKEDNISDGILSVVDSSILSGFNSKRSMRIIFKPVEVRILTEKGKLLTMVSAEFAEVDRRNRQMKFKNNVKVKSGTDTLFTPTFLVVSTSGSAIAQDGYHFITPGKNLKGNKLLTDIFLTTYNDVLKEKL